MILATPAPTFFAMLKSAKELRREEMAVQMRELCDIVAISWGGQKYYESLRNQYSEMLLTPEQLAARRSPRVFDCSSKDRADAAAELFKQCLKI